MAQEELSGLSQSADSVSQSIRELSGILGDAKQKEALEFLNAGTGVNNFGAKLNLVTTALQGITKVAGEHYKQMAAGNKGYKALGSVMDETADALTAAGLALAAFKGPIGLVLAGIGLAGKAANKYIKASAEQSDKLYDAYRNMSRVGAAGSEGLQGVYSDMQKLGLGVQDLDKMVKLMTDNSKELALLGGSVREGRQRFVGAVDATNQYRTSLMRMGLSQDAINEGVASYIRLESRMGSVQKMTYAELGDAAHRYILERDALAKVTGMNMKEQEKALEEVRSQELFRAKVEELRAQGKTAEADELESTYVSLLKVNRTAAQGFADIANGNLMTEAAQKEMRVSQGKTMEVIERISQGQIKSARAGDEIARAHVDFVDAYGMGVARFGNYDRVFGSYAGDQSMKAMLLAGGLEKNRDAADKTQEGQRKGQDKEVNQQVDLVNSQREMMQNMQDFVRMGVGPATKVVKGFNDVLKKITDTVLPGKEAGAAPAGYGKPAVKEVAPPTKPKVEETKPAAPPRAPPAPRPEPPPPPAPRPEPPKQQPAQPPAPVRVPAAPPVPPPRQQAAPVPEPAKVAPVKPVPAAPPPQPPAAAPATSAIPPTAAPTQKPEEAREERKQIEKEAAEAAARAKETKTKEDRIKAEEARKEAEKARAREEHARRQEGAPVTGPAPIPAVPAPGAMPPRAKEEIYAADAKSLVDRLQQYGITNQYALAAIVATARKESNLDYKKEEAGAAEYLATLNKRNIGYIYKVFGQLGPGGRVAKSMGYGDTGIPEDVIRAEWAKGDEAFYQMVYGGLGTNKDEGDAFRYRGRGYIQMTGRATYENVGKALGVNLVDDPGAILRDKGLSEAAVAEYLFYARGGKDKALKDLNEFKTNDEALKYVLRTVAGLGHKEAEFDKQGSHLAEQYRKSSQFMDFANKTVNNGKVPSARDGGVFKGPKSGYPAKLHGEELIAPLDKSSDLMRALENMRSTNEMILQSIQQISVLQRRNTDLDKRMLKQAA